MRAKWAVSTSYFLLAHEIEEEGENQVRSLTLNSCDVIGGDISVLSNRPRFDRPTVFSKHSKMLTLVADISGNIGPFLMR